jgi:hypothetical protein
MVDADGRDLCSQMGNMDVWRRTFEPFAAILGDGDGGWASLTVSAASQPRDLRRFPSWDASSLRRQTPSLASASSRLHCREMRGAQPDRERNDPDEQEQRAHPRDQGTEDHADHGAGLLNR